jgi:hypothetical protein
MTKARRCMRGCGTRSADYRRLVIVKQQVEVEGARRVVILAAASKKTFDGEQGVEQLRRRQAGVQGGDGVDEIGLAADRAVSHRRAAVQRRQAQQSAFGYVGQRATGRTDLRQRVVQVGAQGDVGQVLAVLSVRDAGGSCLASALRSAGCAGSVAH